MKSITPIIDSYTDRKKDLTRQNLKEPDLLKEKIKLSNYFLNKVRLHLRSHVFAAEEDEIHFFKFTKPQICGELIYYNMRRVYLCDRPDSTGRREISFIKSELKKLEAKKRRTSISIDIVKMLK